MKSICIELQQVTAISRPIGLFLTMGLDLVHFLLNFSAFFDYLTKIKKHLNH